MNTESRPRSALPRPCLHLGIAFFAVLLVLAVGFAASPRAQATDDSPTFLLPWQDGVYWQTGSAGFHGSNDALDFFPPDTPLGGPFMCEGDPGWELIESKYWVLASAPGVVAEVNAAYVLINHENGWSTRYYHLSSPQVVFGQLVTAGTRLGHPSTLGECTTGPHVHFWVHGPAGETTYNIILSGVPSTSIGVNEWIAGTGNFDPTPSPTIAPTPTPTATPTPEPTFQPTHSPTPTPAPLPGDADCDGRLTPLDAMQILHVAAELEASLCTSLTGEVNCDGEVDSLDAALVLRAAAEGTPLDVCEHPVQTTTPQATPTASPIATPTPDPQE